MVASVTMLALVAAVAAAPVDGDKAAAAPAAVVNSAPEIGEMVTDRPDFTESSDVVGRGVF